MSEQDGIRATYDAVAELYAQAFVDELQRKPFDRELLGRYAELVRGRGAVWDIGCGPGHVGRYLHERGIPVSGFDLSAEMGGLLPCCASRFALALPQTPASPAEALRCFAASGEKLCSLAPKPSNGDG